MLCSLRAARPQRESCKRMFFSACCHILCSLQYAAAATSCKQPLVHNPDTQTTQTRSSGNFKNTPAPDCASPLAAYYTSGAYARDVEAAARSAYGPLGLLKRSLPTPEEKAARSKQAVIFDIDETLLSNLAAAPVLYQRPLTAGRRLQGACALCSVLRLLLRACVPAFASCAALCVWVCAFVGLPTCLADTATRGTKPYRCRHARRPQLCAAPQLAAAEADAAALQGALGGEGHVLKCEHQIAICMRATIVHITGRSEGDRAMTAHPLSPPTPSHTPHNHTQTHTGDLRRGPPDCVHHRPL